MNTKFYFFSGKGGVGKTTLSCATAVHFAVNGKKTLIITTDPASNLRDVFEQEIGHKVTQIRTVQNLYAMELDPDKATEEYKEKTLKPLRGLIPQESFSVLEEQLNSPCTAEMATFERFTDFVQDSEYDIVIFDTAPTGHTLRLLELPMEWSGIIEEALKDGSSGQTCIGPAAALAESKQKFDNATKVMRDTDNTTFVFVLRPEATPLYEATRSITELEKLNIHSQRLVINGLFPKESCDTAFTLQRYNQQQDFLQKAKEQFSLQINLIELASTEISGIHSLLKIGSQLWDNPITLRDYVPAPIALDTVTINPTNMDTNNPDVSHKLTPYNGQKRNIFFAGKGGVGKTSIAAATGIWVAEQGYKTLLLTTDPASHLGQLFSIKVLSTPTPLDNQKLLYIAHIDPAEVTQEYKEKILAEAAGKYDKQRLRAIEEELNSPCTEEMATFEKFIQYMTSDEFEVIVFDTAPTGHTLKLLELPLDWSKQLEIKTYTNMDESDVDKQTKSKFQKVIKSMQDANQTTFSFVMYPEKTPIEEASRAIAELESIGVKTSIIVANMILQDNSIVNKYWKSRIEMQRKYLKEMLQRFKTDIVKLPLLPTDLLGYSMLKSAGQLLYGTSKKEN